MNRGSSRGRKVSRGRSRGRRVSSGSQESPGPVLSGTMSRINEDLQAKIQPIAAGQQTNTQTQKKLCGKLKSVAQNSNKQQLKIQALISSSLINVQLWQAVGSARRAIYYCTQCNTMHNMH